MSLQMQMQQQQQQSTLQTRGFNIPACLRKLQWMELDAFYTQTIEASQEIEKMCGGDCLDTLKAVINTAFFEGKTMNLSYMLPAHSIVVQALLNMKTQSIKGLYGITMKIEPCSTLTLKDVVSSDLNPLLLEMTVDKFKHTVEMLYYMKEYFLSMFGIALINITCSDRSDVLIILAQNSLSCNICDRAANPNCRLFQCIECNVSSICAECMQTVEGQSYLVAHAESCQPIQDLLQPIVGTMTFAHLCTNCYTPLHKKHPKNHFNPEISFQRTKKKRSIVYKKARCTVSKCKRDICVNCLRHLKKIKCSI